MTLGDFSETCQDLSGVSTILRNNHEHDVTESELFGQEVDRAFQNYRYRALSQPAPRHSLFDFKSNSLVHPNTRS